MDIGVDIRTWIALDCETYYADDYTLSKMTTEAYVRDPRFETIGVGLKIGDTREGRLWLEHEEFRAFAARVDWSHVGVVMHHANFDALILSHRYGVRPGFIIDTLSMARTFVPADVGGSLKRLARYFEIGEKGKRSSWRRTSGGATSRQRSTRAMANTA